jgi:hypothetical protein
LLFLLFFFSLPFSCLFVSLLPDAVVVDNAADAAAAPPAPDDDVDDPIPDNGLLLFSDVFDRGSNGNAACEPAPAPLELVLAVLAATALDAAESLPEARCCLAWAE